MYCMYITTCSIKPWEISMHQTIHVRGLHKQREPFFDTFGHLKTIWAFEYLNDFPQLANLINKTRIL